MAHFDPHLLVMGTMVSVFRTMALIWAIKALSMGPMAIVESLLCTSSLFLVILEAVKNLKTPTYIEFICLFVGLFGTLILVIPE